MKKNLIGIIFILLISFPVIKSQISLKFQTGLGYQEHFSTGIGISFHQNHEFFILYGSNAFIKPSCFSSLLLQYQRFILHSQIIAIDISAGLKMGYSLYTDKYYHWKIFSAIPYLNADHSLNHHISVFMDGGISVNQTLSQIRKNTGEIGTYRKFLPEIKIGLKYTL